jgi:hypothetical protein
VISRDAEVGGLIFDGNVRSLGCDFGFDPERSGKSLPPGPKKRCEALDTDRLGPAEPAR